MSDLPAPPNDPLQRTVILRDGFDDERLSAAEVVERIRRGEVSNGALARSGGGDLQPLAQEPLFRAALDSPQARMAERFRRYPFPWVTAIVVAALAAGQLAEAWSLGRVMREDVLRIDAWWRLAVNAFVPGELFNRPVWTLLQLSLLGTWALLVERLERAYGAAAVALPASLALIVAGACAASTAEGFIVLFPYAIAPLPAIALGLRRWYDAVPELRRSDLTDRLSLIASVPTLGLLVMGANEAFGRPVWWVWTALSIVIGFVAAQLIRPAPLAPRDRLVRARALRAIAIAVVLAPIWVSVLALLAL